jgi:hypothetical protein
MYCCEGHNLNVQRAVVLQGQYEGDGIVRANISVTAKNIRLKRPQKQTW